MKTPRRVWLHHLPHQMAELWETIDALADGGQVSVSVIELATMTGAQPSWTLRALRGLKALGFVIDHGEPGPDSMQEPRILSTREPVIPAGAPARAGACARSVTETTGKQGKKEIL